MQKERFLDFLRTRYRGVISGKPLSHRAAGDAASRCTTIERTLGQDLDQFLAKGSDPLERLREQVTRKRLGRTEDYVSAARRYIDFINAEKRRP